MPKPFILVDPADELPRAFASTGGRLARSWKDLSRLLSRYTAGTVWGAPRVEAVLEFLWAMRGKKGDHRLLVLERLRPESRHALVTAFRTVLGYEDGVRLVEPAEVARVLAAHDWNERYIGGAVDRVIGGLVLYRADLTRDWLGLDRLEGLGVGSPVDLGALAFEGRGLVVRLGNFTLAADRVLASLDSRYRRRTRKELLNLDGSLGARVRRLREGLKVPRTEFPGLSARTLARIERGESARPRPGTLALIARRLRVEVEELGRP